MNRCRWVGPMALLFLALAVAAPSAPQYPVVRTTSGGETETPDLTIDDTSGVVSASTQIETPRLDGEDGSGTDQDGVDLDIAAGQGTGTGDSGDLTFQFAPAGGSGSTANTLEEAARIEGATGQFALWFAITLKELAGTPDNPATGWWDIYFKSDGLYYLEDDGTEVGPLISTSSVVTDHGGLTGLGDDDHTQYALLAGRSGGQTLYGGTGASENLTLESTSNATKGHVVITGGKLTSADATHTGTEMLGLNAVASGNDSVVIGQSADVGPNGVVIGSGAAGGDGAVVIGQGSGATGTQDAVIIGLTATGVDNSIALGLSADATGGGVAIGSGVVADGTGSIAIGGAADAGHSRAIVLGESATSTAANQLVVEGITTAYLGDGVTDATPSPMAVYATGGSGANIDGADLTIGGGASTGHGNGGRVFLNVTPPGATGSSANSYTTGLEIEADADGRFYQDLQIDGLTTATGLIDAVAGVFIDTTGQFQISNGTHQVEVYPSGTEMIVDSDGATMNTLKVSDLDVNVLTGDLTVTAGDATVTAGDVLVTAGGVGIGSGAPSTLLHVDGGGTLPPLDGTADAVIQDADLAILSLVAQNISGFNFGDSGDENAGNLFYDHSSNRLRGRVGGGAIAFILDSSGLWLKDDIVADGVATFGNSSNTRWANVPMLGGHRTGAWVENITTSNYRYILAASNTGDILLDAPSSIHGSKIKAVRAYFRLSGASAGSLTANVAFYEPTGGSTGSATASSGGALFTTDISQTVTATAGTSATLAAGEQCLIRVWVSSNSSDGTLYLNSVEIQYEEREY